MAADDSDTPSYPGAAGGWGSALGVMQSLLRERPSPGAIDTLLVQNKPKGHMCTACAWAKPKEPHALEFCEAGAKATMWDLTSARCTPQTLSEHTLEELRGWSDHDLEKLGRLTDPLRYDAASDRWVACDWDEAFEAIGERLRAIDPKAAVFYASGRASLETSYLYALFARLYGHNNLPDSSNMCHETTSVGLKKVIGSPVGTCTLDDFEHCDTIFYFGQNPGSNSPRFMRDLQQAVERGCRIVVCNPLREKGLLEFVDPQSPLQMTVGSSTKLATLYLQAKPGSDIAVLAGIARRAFEVDAERRAAGERPVLDDRFIAEHTHAFKDFRAFAQAVSWDEIETVTGLPREQIEQAGDILCEAKAAIGIFGMGLTQHVHGATSIGMLANILLMGGHIGRPGTGMSPVRGHSNVQGQRTVGISEKPELVPLDKLAELFDFEPPREEGRNTAKLCEGLLDGSVRAYVGLGGNLARAVPDSERLEPRWRELELTAFVSTTLNRSHLLPGRTAYLLPCLTRSELDRQESGPQTVTMEDSLSHIHGSIGRRTPASSRLRSEVAIVAGMARATLAPHPKRPWDAWVGDYGLIRDLISATYPEQLHDMNARMFNPGGFYRGNAARERQWKTASGKAEFTTPPSLSALGVGSAPGRFHLVTLRSNDQFNTTVYGHEDRLRGLSGSRHILLISPDEMRAHGLEEDQEVTLVTDMDDGVRRAVGGLKVTPYDLPAGTVAGYFPELNPLVPLSYRDEMSDTPAYKGVPVRIETA